MHICLGSPLRRSRSRRIPGAVAEENQDKKSLPSACVSGAVGRSFVAVARCEFEQDSKPDPGRIKRIDEGRLLCLSRRNLKYAMLCTAPEVCLDSKSVERYRE